MSPAVGTQPESHQRDVSYYFRLGSLPLLFFVLILFLSLFILTGTFAPPGTDPLLSKEKYQHFALWYILLGIMSISLLGFASALAKGRGGITARRRTVAGEPFFLEDPHKNYKDFVAIGICTFGGLGLFVLIRAAGLQEYIDIPEPVLQLVVAATEEFAFRFVIPIIFFLLLANIHPNRDVIFFVSILLAGGLFSIFHLFAYALSPYVTEEAVLIEKLIAAGVAGIWSSVLYYIAVRIGAGGEWALLGLVIGHYGFNLMNLGINPQVIVVYMGIAYVVIFFFMLILGYFDDIIKPTSHSPRQNLNRQGLGAGRRYRPASKKNIPRKLNKKWN